MTTFAISARRPPLTGCRTPVMHDPGRERAIVEDRWEEFQEGRAHSLALTDRREFLTAIVRSRAEEWRAASRFSSSMTQITAHHAYRAVVNLGSEVVPILLQELQRRPEPWFTALREITGENPVRSEQRGDMSAMADAWLRWGRARGLV